eukprot:PITA_10842
MWLDLVQEVIQRNTKDGSSSKTDDEENIALVGKEKKGKGSETEPSSFEEAVKQTVWVDAMLEEYDSIVHNSVWDVVPRPTYNSVLSQAMVRLTKLYWNAVKHVLRYLRGTTQYGLWYRRIEGVKLQGFTDVDWAWSPSDKKITLGGIFSIGSTTVSWYNRKQRSVTLSSTEA